MTPKATKQTLEDLQKQIKVSFKDPSLLERAFIHRSYLNEHPKSGLEHNERLEFWATPYSNWW